MAGFKSKLQTKSIPSLFDSHPYGFSGLSIMAKDKLAVTDAYNKRVIMFSSDGKKTQEAGKKKLRGPSGISAYGNEWFVADSGSDKHRVVVYNEAGAYLREFPTQGITEPGILAVSERFVAVIDINSLSITIYEKDGTVYSQISPTFSEKRESKYKDLTRYEAATPTDYISPENCAFDNEENIYMTFGEAAPFIKVYTADGEFVKKIGDWKYASGIFITAQGNIVVADRMDRKVDVVKTDGTMVMENALCPVKGLTLYPHHICVVEGSTVAVTVAPDMFSLPNKVQLLQI